MAGVGYDPFICRRLAGKVGSGLPPLPSRRRLEISDSSPPLLWGKDRLNESGQKCLDEEDLISHIWKGG